MNHPNLHCSYLLSLTLSLSPTTTCIFWYTVIVVCCAMVHLRAAESRTIDTWDGSRAEYKPSPLSLVLCVTIQLAIPLIYINMANMNSKCKRLFAIKFMKQIYVTTELAVCHRPVRSPNCHDHDSLTRHDCIFHDSYDPPRSFPFASHPSDNCS